MELKQITFQQYDAFLQKQTNRSFLQSYQQGNKMKHDGWEVEYLAYFDQDQILAACMITCLPLLKVFKYAYIPRGVLIDYTNDSLLCQFMCSLKKYLKKKRVLYAELNPYIPYQEHDKDGNVVEGGWNHFQEVENLKKAGCIHLPLWVGDNLSKEPRWISVTDLRNVSEEELFASFSYQTRQDIRTSQKYCVKVRELAQDELDILNTMEQETSKRQNFKPFPMSFFQDLYTYFGKDHIKSVIAELDLKEYRATIQSEFDKTKKELEEVNAFLNEQPNHTKKLKKQKTLLEYYHSLEKKQESMSEFDGLDTLPLACSLYIKYGEELLYLVSGSLYEYRMYRGVYAIQWEMMKEALKEGYTYYNFYGISGYFEKGQPGYGVFDFKRGFNADVVELMGNFILPINTCLFKLYDFLNKVSTMGEK